MCFKKFKGFFTNQLIFYNYIYIKIYVYICIYLKWFGDTKRFFKRVNIKERKEVELNYDIPMKEGDEVFCHCKSIGKLARARELEN